MEPAELMQPQLQRVTAHGIAYWTDRALQDSTGILVAFSERLGGISKGQFDSLNLASHVGDDPDCVDENRSRFLEALGIMECRTDLVTAEQVHGVKVATVGRQDAGSGAFAAGGRGALPQTDAILTGEQRVPLMLCYADCVPIVIVAPSRTVAVVHAGWRGAIEEMASSAAIALARIAGCSARDLTAYIGPHIHACHYEVDDTLMSQFVNKFGTLARADSGGLDLDAAVTASLDRAGVIPCNIARLGICTAETTDRFFSHRAEHGRTGRHAALVCVL
ncbi:MAG: laccase domain-containing protein [Coriobacteriia bacterium]|nr:laccase domain-containing protein [Coriobacteriia bacterium]